MKWLFNILLPVVLSALAGGGCASLGLRQEPQEQREPWEQLYDEAVNEYRRGNFVESIRKLEMADKAKPDVVRVNVLLGWNHRRLGESARAEAYFAKALSLDRSVEDAKLGLAYTSLDNDKPSLALPLFQELAEKRPQDKAIQMALGEAYVKSGQNVAAVQLYQAMLQRDPQDTAARQKLLSLYGYPEYSPDLPWTFSPLQRPSQPESYFRTRGDYFQTRVGNEWRDIYLVGVNIGPARPGEFPATASRDFAIYREWLKQIAEMNANTVRVYTILPPAFYQALKAHNETAASPLWLVQEVWIADEAENLYDPVTEKEFEQTITDTIDLLHGRADLSYRRGHHYGIYAADVSRYVVALAIGREIEPRMAVFTNRTNPSQTSYQGRYVSLPSGTPTEVWFARMCDLAVRYESEKYNAQRPVTVVNWPPLDPLFHPVEASYEEELAIRRRLGEVLGEQPLPPIPNDYDIVSLDVTKFKTEPDFLAGLFALYHVYPHWPDFLLYEPRYALARDQEGPNRYLAYLQELKEIHVNFPLLIGEYGISTSLAPAHLHPQGWNNGGLTEEQQAELLVRFTKNIRETRCAGGLVFAWQDEWFKHAQDLNTADFAMPWDRNPLWLNVLDAEKRFGIVGYQPDTPVPLLRGDPADWRDARQLYSRDKETQRDPFVGDQVRAVYAYSDFTYFYLRLDVDPDALDWSRWNYWIALNTLPGRSGSRMLPEVGVRVEVGANFLVQLDGPTSSRILIADNYSPNERVSFPGRPGLTRLWRKRGMRVEITNSARFEEITVEVNRPRYARDGRFFPPLNYNRSPLRMGSADPAHPQFSSHAMWSVNPQTAMIELRIPWGLLLLMDPSRLEAFGGTDEKMYTSERGAWLPKPRQTEGIDVAVLVVGVARNGASEQKFVSSSRPPLSDGQWINSALRYTWQKWNEVRYRPYFKQSYFALQKVFGEIQVTNGIFKQ